MAASAALTAAGSASIGVAAAGASSVNFIEDMTEAFISSSTITNDAGGVTVKATDSAGIQALVGAAAVAAAIGGSAGVGIAVGIAVGLNEINAGTAGSIGAVEAYILNTSMNATGVIDVEANVGGNH